MTLGSNCYVSKIFFPRWSYKISKNPIVEVAYIINYAFFRLFARSLIPFIFKQTSVFVLLLFPVFVKQRDFFQKLFCLMIVIDG